MISEKLTGSENIIGLNNANLKDFWSWAYSDFLCNTIRPLFAEYIIGYALGLTDKPRIEWNYVDFIYRDKKIEVKSSGYLQSWNQEGRSKIKFDIEKKVPWYASTNSYGIIAERSADLYVFCLLNEDNPNKICVYDVNQWKFFVISTDLINQAFGDQKSVSLNRLKKYSTSVDYDNLKQVIENHLFS